MKSSKTSFLRNCISGWNVRRHRTAFSSCDFGVKYVYLRNEWVQVWHGCFVCAPFYTYDYSFSI